MASRNGKIHYAKLENSERLKRVLMFLSSGGEFTTREIVNGAQVCAVNTAISELRANGIEILSRCIGKGVYTYQLEEFAPPLREICGLPVVINDAIPFGEIHIMDSKGRTFEIIKGVSA